MDHQTLYSLKDPCQMMSTCIDMLLENDLFLLLIIYVSLHQKNITRITGQNVKQHITKATRKHKRECTF